VLKNKFNEMHLSGEKQEETASFEEEKGKNHEELFNKYKRLGQKSKGSKVIIKRKSISWN